MLTVPMFRLWRPIWDVELGLHRSGSMSLPSNASGGEHRSPPSRPKSFDASHPNAFSL